MLAVSVLLLYLGIVRKYEPLLLVPIGFGALLANIPLAGMTADGGLLHYFYFGIETGIFPPLIFLGVGAMTDFGPLLAKPNTFLLGAAAQFGIFGTLLGARALGFSFAESASIAIIGGADGPTAIYLTSQLAEHLLGPIAVAAYSYMALVPVIQPPIIRALTSEKERVVVMSDVKQVSQRVKIVFPVVTTIVIALSIPAATPLVGMLMLGNLLREAGVVERLSKTAQNELVNIVDDTARCERREQNVGGGVPRDRHAVHHRAGADRVLDRYGQRRAAWKTDVRNQRRQGQSDDRCSRRVGGTHGRPGGSEGRPGGPIPATSSS